jgi:hypothetical protein
LTVPARDRFIQAAYGLLDLISFLTSGEDEVRAWPIRRNTPAVRAAGKIHSETSSAAFIRAEVVAYDDFVRLGSDAKCREAASSGWKEKSTGRGRGHHPLRFNVDCSPQRRRDAEARVERYSQRSQRSLAVKVFLLPRPCVAGACR